jgi:excisionase family DNA binding protein
MPELRVVDPDVRPFFSVASLARKLAVSERTVRDILNRGDLPCYRVGVQRRIAPEDVDSWLEQNRERPRGNAQKRPWLNRP